MLCICVCVCWVCVCVCVCVCVWSSVIIVSLQVGWMSLACYIPVCVRSVFLPSRSLSFQLPEQAPQVRPSHLEWGHLWEYAVGNGHSHKHCTQHYDVGHDLSLSKCYRDRETMSVTFLCCVNVPLSGMGSEAFFHCMWPACVYCSSLALRG